MLLPNASNSFMRCPFFVKAAKGILTVVGALLISWHSATPAYATMGVTWDRFEWSSKRMLILGITSSYHWTRGGWDTTSECATGYLNAAYHYEDDELLKSMNTFAHDEPAGNVELFAINYIIAHCKDISTDKRREEPRFDLNVRGDLSRVLFLGAVNSAAAMLTKYANEKTAQCAIDHLNEEGYRQIAHTLREIPYTDEAGLMVTKAFHKLCD